MKIKLNLKSKIAAVFTVMGLLLAAGIGLMAYNLSYRQIEKQYTDAALSSARMAAALVDGGGIDGYLQNGADKTYEASYEKLQKLKDAYDLTYLYIIRPDTEKNDGVYIFDIYTEGNDHSLIAELGDPAGEDSVYDTVLEIYLTGHSQNDAIITNTEFGYLSSAYVPLYAPDGSVSAVVGADISMDIILSDARAQTLQISGAVFGVTVLILIILLLTMQRGVLSPIVRLSRHMETFAAQDGEFKEFTVPQTGDELQTAGESFNRMVSDLKRYMENLTAVTADRERISTELNVAARIQASLLPCIFPPFPDRKEFELCASMQPAKEVGGDFYDFFLVDENTLAAVMADVSGKGVPAALFMVIAKTLIKNNAQSGKSPKEVFEAVNSILCENNDEGMFVTAFMGYLDIPSGCFTYVNAGHNPPLIRKAGGQYEKLPAKPCFILAGIEESPYTQQEIMLKPGDELFLYTDGVTEAVDPSQDLFGETRLLETVNNNLDLPLFDLAVNVKQEIDKFADGAEQADDITILALRYEGK